MGWQKVKLGQFLKNREGRYKPNDKAIQGLRRIDKINFSGTIYFSDKSSNTDMILVKKGDLVISGINVEKGAMNIYQGDEDVVATIHYSSYELDEEKIDIDYLTNFLKSIEFRKALKDQVPGGIKTEIKPKHILPLLVEIPTDIREQKRAVKRLIESNVLIEKVSSELTHQLNLIKQLRQAFLREAMEGKLVKAADIKETGQQLLLKIEAEKAQLIAEKKIKKEKELPIITEDELPFKIPEHWAWCRLGNLRDFRYTLSYGVLVPGNDIEGGVPLVRVQDLDNSNLEKPPSKHISLEIEKKFSKTRLIGGEILICVVGSIGKIAFTNKSWIGANIARAICRLMPNQYINSSFIFNVLLSPYVQDFFEIHKRSINPTLNVNVLETTLIPVPPLHEQEQIVANLKELMEFCDSLEKSVKKSMTYNHMLAQQVLKEALRPQEEVLDVDSLFNDKNYNLHVAMIQTLIESQLGINHGEVANQKTIFHINTFTNEKIPYQFVNHNFGTFSQQLRDDFSKNPYLTKSTKNNKEVFVVKSSKQKEVLDSIYKSENKNFVNAVKEVLDIYELPSINKETDKIELLNTVSKLIMDLNSIEIDVIYQGMEDWKIIQQGFNCKADKFSKAETEKMIRLIQNKGLESKLLNK